MKQTAKRVKMGIFGIGFCSTEGVANSLLILGREKHPHDLASISVMLEDLLADELTLAIAIGGEPYPLSGAQCLANGSQLRGLVTTVGRPRAVEAFGPKKNCRPALPCRHNVLRFKQVEQMTLGRKDLAIAPADGSADVFRLTGFFGDDNLGHKPNADAWRRVRNNH